ncbi:GNAT family N-acetyltransferase [Mobilitalea sibirica]|uniref:GNAT family N-acetyltransferase n=1 Tax=Mobilitalea sibirica TaxID=1462919 RepID=A0A8J7HCR5_9FIRM|nr:GNAT family N-acetyltransferase [Mobilitalea sibirica]MBH1942575.1 GNAT family N-acetyltransferase [Mobilitalea sibirica]
MDLVGKRIILRKFQKSDMDFLYTLNNDPLVNRYLSYHSMESEKCQYFIELWKENYHDEIVNVHKIIIKDIETDIGLVFLVKRENGVYELGYRILPQFWHAGYASESAKLLIFKFFEKYDNCIWAETHPANEKSMKLLKKLGFKEVIKKKCK